MTVRQEADVGHMSDQEAGVGLVVVRRAAVTWGMPVSCHTME